MDPNLDRKRPSVSRRPANAPSPAAQQARGIVVEFKVSESCYSDCNPYF